MNQSEELKINQEIEVFKSFAKISQYKIVENSIIHKDPPEPDILCETIDGKKIAFELVECVFDNIARSFSDSAELTKIFYDKLKKLPVIQKKQIERIFRNACIAIDFKNNVSKTIRKRTIEKIFNFLLILKKDEEGKFIPKKFNSISDIVNCIYITRGKFNGPSFQVIDAGTFIGNPALTNIQKKFNKSYKSTAPIELLAYYYIQPEIPDNIWKFTLKNFISNNISHSPFQRVWLFSFPQNKILFTFPKPNEVYADK